jgi:glycosyltransferase involved in cell wall biosynthesis
MATIAVDARAINSTTGRYIERLLVHLEAIADSHRFIVLMQSRDLDYYRPVTPRFTVVPADFESYSFREQAGFLQLLRRLEPDLVHFCMPQQPVLYAGRSVTTVHDLTLLKTQNSHHNRLVFRTKQAVGRAVFRRIARTSSAVLVPSEQTRDEYTAFTRIPGDKVHVTYEGADPATGDEETLPDLEGRSFLLYVGTQSDYKNVRRLVQAHQRLQSAHPGLVLALVGRIEGRGGASLRPNQQWVQDEGFVNVLFTGYVSDEQLAWLYRHASAYVFPSLMEGFGLPGLEAMTYGTPLVSSNASCLPEIYGDGATYFDPLDLESMTDAIARVLTDVQHVAEIRARGFARAERYSWRRMAEQTLQVYESVLTQ